jgi:hypothetical protein
MANGIAQLILDQARRTGADPYTLLATAIVESSLNPNAVGDGGTSYGLFQMHVGGAGGSSHDSARRYLDPRVAAENRARHFRGGSGGAFAASVQRPADPAGYARKVDAVIAQLRSGKSPHLAGGKGALNAPVASQGVTEANGAGPDRKAAALSLIFDGDPFWQMLAASAPSNAGPSPVSTPGQATTAGGVPARLPGEPGWKYLQRVARIKFGLKNDPGNSQTTGGRHAAGSPHYDGRAIDFGTARNSWQDLDAWAKYARQNFDALGLQRVIWQEDGHYDHVDVATLRGAKGIKKR